MVQKGLCCRRHLHIYIFSRYVVIHQKYRKNYKLLLPRSRCNPPFILNLFDANTSIEANIFENEFLLLEKSSKKKKNKGERANPSSMKSSRIYGIYATPGTCGWILSDETKCYQKPSESIDSTIFHRWRIRHSPLQKNTDITCCIVDASHIEQSLNLDDPNYWRPIQIRR